MFCGCDPVAHHLFKLLGRHARMGRHEELTEGTLAAGEDGLHVAPEQRSERLLRSPFRMPGRKRLDAIQHEEELEVHRLFGPERTVIVEDRNTFGWGNEIRRVFPGDPVDESENGLPGRTIVPRWQRVVCAGRRRARKDCRKQQGQHNRMSQHIHGSASFCLPRPPIPRLPSSPIRPKAGRCCCASRTRHEAEGCVRDFPVHDVFPVTSPIRADFGSVTSLKLTVWLVHRRRGVVSQSAASFFSTSFTF